jgi:hypothetical protein
MRLISRIKFGISWIKKDSMWEIDFFIKTNLELKKVKLIYLTQIINSS